MLWNTGSCLPWDTGIQSDLFARIDHWKQGVVKDTLQQGYTNQTRSPKYEPHHMKLRTRDTRPALAEVSGNPYSRKRKASASMADAPARKSGKKAVMDENIEGAARRPGRPAKNLKDNDEEEALEQPPPARRGRPPKKGELTHPPDLSLRIGPGNPFSTWSPSASGSPRKSSTSPSKKGQMTLDKQVSEAAIDMEYLSRCNPRVNLTTFRKLHLAGKGIPSQVEALFRNLQDVPTGPIPFALKVSFSPTHR